MPLDTQRTRQYLKAFQFGPLFSEEMGWERYSSTIHTTVDSLTFDLKGIAEKRGLIAFLCSSSDGQIPDYATRRKIEAQVAKTAFEHIIVYIDAGQTTQVWQWVRRELGKPAASREHAYNVGQPGDALIQKLQAIVFNLEEEESLTTVAVAGRVRVAFDVERVTKRFYDRFKTEHAQFLKFILGIPDKEMQRWYASVMINRLMFIYFIQKKGFLNNDGDYLRSKLRESKRRGKDLYYSEFLSPLFFKGFAEKESSEATNRLLGKVPYLNGGLFLKHQIEEQYGRTIEIRDSAFEKLFDFFDGYQWHLDERPLRQDNEINPDVLGYIFEKYINQKQMGAYYTKEDITEYISKNTIIPFLFNKAREKCRIAFEGDHSIWRSLQVDPERYIYDAMKMGVDLELPNHIAAGVDDVSKRTGWNKKAPTEFALPTEMWREVALRRKQYEEIRTKLAAGQVRNINDLITYNLDIRQFAQDIIQGCEGPDLLNAFWHATEKVTVLDPACGSGAFLFAALNILEPLYEACLDRMEVFLQEWGEKGRKLHPNYHKLFSDIRTRLEQHPNRRYFILKSIIINNLFGADIMEEATEICKLRLFLKLVAQVERDEQIEPLPDIDFNIRAGNTLVGYATYKDVQRAFGSKLDFEDTMSRIEETAQDIDRLFALFRQQQTEFGGQVTPQDKKELRERLKVLEDELNVDLSGEYGIKATNRDAYKAWLGTHKPFHWFIEFHSIISKGGFDTIIGNPPYLELREVNYSPRGFKCRESGAVHAMFVERGLQLLDDEGTMSMIVPLSLVSTQRMRILQEVLESHGNAWYANYSWRPAKLFDTVNRALTIFVVTPSTHPTTFSTGYRKWTSENRDLLITGVEYVEVSRERTACWAPKLGQHIELGLLNKLLAIPTPLRYFMGDSKNRVYYRTTGGLYWKVFTDFAPAFRVNGKKGHSTRETWFTLAKPEALPTTIAVLSSDLFWWWYTITTNCRDLNPYDLQNFPVPQSVLLDRTLATIGANYLKDLRLNSTMLVREQKQTGRTETQSFKIQKSKPIIDEIDRVLAQHYGFNEEELDFIINYDIKYRMGIGASEEDEE